MAKIIRVAEIENGHPGTGRHIGKMVGLKIEPGDTVDFQGLLTTTNSFADELIVTFLERHSFEDLKTLKFKNASPLLTILIKRAIHRRVLEARKDVDHSFGRQQFCPAS